MEKKMCQRCKRSQVKPGYRFCSFCKIIVMHEMRASGYLTPLPPPPKRRTRDQKEDIYETKHGKTS